MGDAPQRIWVNPNYQNSKTLRHSSPSGSSHPQIEYIRADIAEARIRELEGAATETLSAYNAVEAEAERAQRPGANAWSSAPVIRLVHAYKALRAALEESE